MKTVSIAALLVLFAHAAMADTISAQEIVGGIGPQHTELQQEAWWKANMAGKVHEITGKVDEVEEGTFSGFWVRMMVGKKVRVSCGLDTSQADRVMALKKGDTFTCKGLVGSTWTALFGIQFQIEEEGA